jgi:hypothetical protein
VRSIFKTLVLFICFCCGVVSYFSTDVLFLSRFVKIGPMSLGDMKNEEVLVTLGVSFGLRLVSKLDCFAVGLYNTVKEPYFSKDCVPGTIDLDLTMPVCPLWVLASFREKFER